MQQLPDLTGIPPEVYESKLGNRSALEWIVDQYQVSTDKRSNITNYPNRPKSQIADPQSIVRLIGQVTSVSLETVRLVNELSTYPIQRTCIQVNGRTIPANPHAKNRSHSSHRVGRRFSPGILHRGTHFLRGLDGPELLPLGKFGTRRSKEIQARGRNRPFPSPSHFLTTNH
jgi:hypothetical protein